MATKIMWRGDLTSVKAFFKYMIIIWKDKGWFEQEINVKDIYQDYVNYCITVDIDYYAFETFQRVLTSLGIESKVVWNDGKKMPNRVRIINMDLMLQIVADYEEPFFTTSQIVSLDGKLYMLTTKMKEIMEPKDFRPLPNFQEKLNQDKFNNYGQQQPTTTDQQSSGSDERGDSPEVETGE